MSYLPFGASALIEMEVRDRKQAGKPLIDPVGLSATLIDPTGTASTYVYGTAAELTRTAAGKYTLEVDVLISGVWRWTLDFSTPNGAEDGTFTVGLNPAA